MVGNESQSQQAQSSPAQQDSPRLTEAAFVEELQALIKRGEDAGLSPVTIVTRVIFRRGVGMLDTFFADVEKSMGNTKKG